MFSASTLVAISGMLAAAPIPRAGAAMAAVEIAFATHAGEGASGQKRVTREGCYQVESGGSTGGAGYAHDRQAGCHRRADVAAIFARLDAIGADRLVRESFGRDSANGGAARGAPARGMMPGGAETRVVLIRTDGSRWVAANQATDDDIQRAVNDLPGEDQWYAEPPASSAGAGPQLLALSVASRHSGAARLQASLASDGRWWCYRTTIGARGAEPKLPTKKPSPLMDAPARLRRIFDGVRPQTGDDAPGAQARRADGSEISVEVAWPGQARAPLRPAQAADAVSQRFGAEMEPLSPACAIR